jgi:Phosphotransferase enzyme family
VPDQITTQASTPRPTTGLRQIHASAADLLAGATERTPLAAPGKSGARLERVLIGGERYVLKHLDLAEDWTMRASGCLRGAALELWARGILGRLPECFNQPIVAVARSDGGQPPPSKQPPPSEHPRPSGGCVLLMRDVARWLVPATDEPITLGQHLRFLRHMAALHAAFWDCGADVDVVPAMHRYLELSPWLAEAEAAIGSGHLVPRLVGEGWPLLARVAPAAAAVVTPLARDPGPLVQALADTPQTFVHGNWKLDNLGTDADGRTVLLDWEQPGRGAPLSDLAWYLAINCRRLPQSKEDSIQAYRDALEGAGIATEPWWQRQLELCLLGALVQFGWEKALGGYDAELAWWEARAVPAARLLDHTD